MKRIYLLIPTTVFVFSHLLNAQGEPTKPSPKNQKVFSLNINAPADAIATDIEFSDIDLAKATDVEKIGGARVKVVRTKEKVFREALGPEVQFFRVRSIHKTGVAGAYSRSYSVKDYLRKAYREPKLPLVQEGQTEYLLGSRIELPVQPNLVTKYKIGEGEFIEYREPLVFDKPDTYKMQVNLENSANEVVFTKNYVFKVELNPPRTRVVISEPLHSKRGITIGKNSSVVFLVDDAESGRAKTFYRVVTFGKDMNALPFIEYGKRLTYSDLQGVGGMGVLQFYSLDKAGNKEEIKTEIFYTEE